MQAEQAYEAHAIIMPRLNNNKSSCVGDLMHYMFAQEPELDGFQ